MTKLGTKWVRNDQTGYEITKLKIKVGMKWPKWYEMTWVRNKLGTKWPVTIWATSWQNQQCACAPSEDSDQPGHPPSLIRVFAVRLMGSYIRTQAFFMRTAKTDHTGRMPRLIWVFAGRTCHFVGFVTRRLIFKQNTETMRRDVTILHNRLPFNVSGWATVVLLRPCYFSFLRLLIPTLSLFRKTAFAIRNVIRADMA